MNHSPSELGRQQAIAFLRKLTPGALYDYALAPLNEWFYVAHPFDLIATVYARSGDSVDTFGLEVISQLFTRDELRPRYRDLLVFVSKTSANPDPIRWAVAVLRYACIETLLLRILDRPAIPDDSEKPNKDGSRSVAGPLDTGARPVRATRSRAPQSV